MSSSKPRKHTDPLQEHLLKLADALAQSGSELEEAGWKQVMRAQLIKSLEEGHEEQVVDALESLGTQTPPPPAQSAFAASLEEVAETLHFELDGKPHAALLIAIPVLAWSRYSLPEGSLPRRTLNLLRTRFASGYLGQTAKFTLADFLFSPDQLPQTFTATRRLLQALTDACQKNTLLKVDPTTLPETGRFLADIRYLLGVVVVPENAPIFSWQEDQVTRDQAHAVWIEQGISQLAPLFTGCAFKALPAEAYHTACRAADRQARGYAVEASVAFLQAILNLLPQHIQATIAACYDPDLVEYRVGLGPHDADQIFQGMVWPILDDEDTDALAEIEKTLGLCGIVKINHLPGRFPSEFCEDCGSPFYPAPSGELVHPEMPEENPQTSLSLH